MRLIDASDDDVLGIQAWGDGISASAWVAAGRALRGLTGRWTTHTGIPPWEGPDGPAALRALVTTALALDGGAVCPTPAALHATVGDDTLCLATAPVRLDLAAYDPDQVLRAHLDAVLVTVDTLPPLGDGTLRGGLLAVVHHVHATGTLTPAAAVQRYLSLPTAAVEKRAPRGVRIDCFPPRPEVPRDTGHPWVFPGWSVLVGIVHG